MAAAESAGCVGWQQQSNPRAPCAMPDELHEKGIKVDLLIGVQWHEWNCDICHIITCMKYLVCCKYDVSEMDAMHSNAFLEVVTSKAQSAFVSIPDP